MIGDLGLILKGIDTLTVIGMMSLDEITSVLWNKS